MSAMTMSAALVAGKVSIASKSARKTQSVKSRCVHATRVRFRYGFGTRHCEKPKLLRDVFLSRPMRLTRTTSDGWSWRARRDFGVIMALTRLSRHTRTTRWSRFALPRARSSDTEGSRERTDTNGLGAGLANAEIWNVLRHGFFLDRCDFPTRAMERRHPAKALQLTFPHPSLTTPNQETHRVPRRRGAGHAQAGSS